jgi:hypothetical protein
VRLIRIGVCWQEMSVRRTIGAVFSGRLATHRRAIGGNFPGVLGMEWEEIRSNANGEQQDAERNGRNSAQPDTTLRILAKGRGGPPPSTKL